MKKIYYLILPCYLLLPLDSSSQTIKPVSPKLKTTKFLTFSEKDTAKKGSGQSANLQNNSVVSSLIPPTPEAASLGKYGTNPVGMYTGIPSISIPLYQIKQKDLLLDLSLSYHAGGIRVEETAPWTGLG